MIRSASTRASTRASAAAALLALAVAAPGARAQNIEIEAEGPVIELGIHESITVAPDIATIGAGVTSEAPTAVAAMRQNAQAMSAVIARIKVLGVPERDIQTTGISLNARYDYDQAGRRQIFRGYQVSNRVSVKLAQIDKVGEVLDALVVAGATDLSGPVFGIEDDEAAKDAARKRALERARARAEAYAALLGYAGARVLTISETLEHRGPMPEMAMAARMVSAARPDAAPVEPGMVAAGVSLTIKFELVGGPQAAP